MLGAVSVLGALAPPALAFVDVSVGLPVGDDISHVTYGATTDELWVGTEGGRLYLSTNGGETWRQVFEVPAVEPIVVPELTDLSAATPRDFGRAPDRAVDSRDRAGRSKRLADAAGNARGADRRDRGECCAPLLASLVRPASREPTNLNQTKLCHGFVFVATGSGLFRARREDLRFEQLPIGMDEAGHDAEWIGCDTSRPGRIMVDLGTLVLESQDAGESFSYYRTPVPRSLGSLVADFDTEGRLLVTAGREIYRERPEGGFTKICALQGDSVASEQVGWSWWVESGDVFAVTKDGVLVCKDGEARRLPDPRLSDEIRFLWIDEPNPGHMYVATRSNVYESFDGGETFREIFTAPVPRSITRMAQGDTRDELLIVTGSHIFRTSAVVLRRDEIVATATARLLAEVPMAAVVEAAMGRFDLLPGDVVGRRGLLRWRSLLPVVLGQVVHDDTRQSDLVTPFTTFEAEARRTGSGRAWIVLALWDLGELVFDPVIYDTSWVDLEQLRSRVSFRVQDSYTQWLRARALLADETLPDAIRAHHTLTARAAAAYLDHVTGGAFAAFHQEI